MAGDYWREMIMTQTVFVGRSLAETLHVAWGMESVMAPGMDRE
jgi:hypothetical protein